MCIPYPYLMIVGVVIITTPAFPLASINTYIDTYIAYSENLTSAQQTLTN